MIAAKLGVVLLLVSGLEAGPGPKAAPGPAPEPAPWGWRFINSNGVQGASGNPYAVADPYAVDPYAVADPYAPVAPIAPVAPVLPIDGVAGANLPWNFFINAEQPQTGVKSMSGDLSGSDQISINLGGPGRWWWKKK